MLLSIKTRAINKMGICHTKLICSLVHKGDKAFFTPRNGFAKRHAGIVCRGYHRRL